MSTNGEEAGPCGGGTGTPPGGGGTAVAMYPGPPKAGVSCAGSPVTVDTSFIDQFGATVNVTDINSIWKTGTEVGWLYRGSNGKIYAQPNYTWQAGLNWAATFGIFGTVGGSVGGNSPSYGPIKQVKDGSSLNGGAPAQCFTQGANLGPLA